MGESARRRRRQYGGYGGPQQYGNQYGMYGPGGQGWGNNFNNQNPNQQGYGWNNNNNWNQGNRRPEWYYNSGTSVGPSLLSLLLVALFFLY